MCVCIYMYIYIYMYINTWHLYVVASTSVRTRERGTSRKNNKFRIHPYKV